MYRLGHRTYHKHVFLYAFFLLIILGAGIAYSVANLSSQDTTVINQAPPDSTVVSDSADTVLKTFSEGVFSLQLPSDWKYIGQDATSPYHPYQWKNTAGTPGVRLLALYVDSLPTDMAVNRLLPVQNESDHLTPGTVSDNCTSFTGNGKMPSADVTAKWAGVNFICDMENYERDVVGTSSPNATNSVTLAGPINGQHKFFFTYTDDSQQPDFTIFTQAVSSFIVQ